MRDFEKELEDILTNDPLGLLKIKPKVSKIYSLEDTKNALYAIINREVIGKAVIKVR